MPITVGGRKQHQGKNARSSCMPWRGTWGPLSDGRSRVSRLAKRIEKELIDELKPTTPRQRRATRRAAELEALEEQTAKTMGTDPKATRRALTALARAADSKIAQVKASSNGQREPEFDPAAALAKQRSEP